MPPYELGGLQATLCSTGNIRLRVVKINQPISSAQRIQPTR